LLYEGWHAGQHHSSGAIQHYSSTYRIHCGDTQAATTVRWIYRSVPHRATASVTTDPFCTYEVGDAAPLLQTVYASVSANSQLLSRLDHLTNSVTSAETVMVV